MPTWAGCHRGQRHSSGTSRAGEMNLPWLLFFASTSALPSADPDAEAEPQLYGEGYNSMLRSSGPGGQGYNPGGALLPGEGGQGYFPGGAGGASMVQPGGVGGVWGGGVPQGDQCGMMDQCCGEYNFFKAQTLPGLLTNSLTISH